MSLTKSIVKKVLITTAQKQLEKMASEKGFAYKKTGTETADLVAVVPVPETGQGLNIILHAEIKVV